MAHNVQVKLSRREVQCIDYLLQGLSNKLIAAELHLSQRTIESYVDSIKIKLCCRNKMELIIALTKHYTPMP